MVSVCPMHTAMAMGESGAKHAGVSCCCLGGCLEGEWWKERSRAEGGAASSLRLVMTQRAAAFYFAKRFPWPFNAEGLVVVVVGLPMFWGRVMGCVCRMGGARKGWMISGLAWWS